MSIFNVVVVFVLLLVFAYVLRPRPVPVISGWRPQFLGTVDSPPQVQEPEPKTPEPKRPTYGNSKCDMDLVGCNCRDATSQRERPLATVTQISDAPSLRPAT